MTLTVRSTPATMLLVIAHVYFGVGYLIGPPRFYSSGSYTVALSWAPVHVWGALIVTGALCALATPWVPPLAAFTAHLLAAIPLAVFGVAILLAQLDGTAQGWGGPGAYAIPVTLHIWLALQHIKQDGGRTHV